MKILVALTLGALLFLQTTGAANSYRSSPSIRRKHSPALNQTTANQRKLVEVFIGCYEDAIDRAFPIRAPASGQPYSVDQCRSKCSGDGYAYAGLQHLGQCFCGNDGYDKYGSTTGCNCNGPDFGSWKNCVYGPATGGQFLGCYRDTEDRALPIRAPASDQPYSVGECKSKCFNDGYAYAGLQYEGECWCGTAQMAYYKHGELFECNCNGPNFGSWTLCVHGLSTEAPPDGQFLGCYMDAPNRALPIRAPASGDPYSVDKCTSKCFNDGYAYAGLQWLGECWCANSGYDRYGQTDGCDCDGPNYGGYMNCVYRRTSSPPLSYIDGTWEIRSNQNIDGRHEGCFVMAGSRAYLIGGYESIEVDIWNPATGTWSKAPRGSGYLTPPLLHHMQCVVVGNKIYIPAAFTGAYPQENNVDKLWVFNTANNRWETEVALPERRRRGSASAVAVGNKIWVSHGKRHGQSRGWIDCYDIQKKWWIIGDKDGFPDAPNWRDHAGGALVNGRICVAGGRNGGQSVSQTDCYNPQTNTWTREANIPEARSGSAYGLSCDGKLIVAGGDQILSGQVDMFDGNGWSTFRNDMVQKRHGTGIAVDCQRNKLYIASGSPNQGRGTTTSMEIYTPPP